MTFNSELTPDRAADVVFGDTAQLVDWQNDIASVVPLITLNPEAGLIVRFQAERLAAMRATGMKCVDHASQLAARKPVGFLREVDTFRKAMACFEEADRIAHTNGPVRGLLEGDRFVREALWDILEDEALEFDRMRTALRAEIQSDLDRLDRLQKQQLEQAEKLLIDGLLEAPHERSRILRESRRLYREVTTESGSHVSCAVWAQYCWLTWQVTANEEDTMIPLEFAVNQPSSGAGLGKSLCARLYAYVLARYDRYEEAYTWSHAAASIWPNVGSLHERARYAAMAGRADIIRREMDALVQVGPLGIIMAYSDPTFLVLAPHLLDTTIREQMKMRQIARQEISSWEAMVRKTLEVRRRVPSISLPHDLTDGIDKLRASIDEAGFLYSAQQIRRAGGAREDLKCLTIAALNTEKKKRIEAIAIARKNIDAAMEGRDNWIQASFAAHEESLRSVRSIVSNSDSKGDAAQRGCGYGMSSGCVILTTYMIGATFLASRGIIIGPHTLTGELCLVLAALPVFVALLYHVAYSARRLMIDAQVNTQILASSEQYEKSRQEANEHFRARIEASQAQLAEEDNQLVQVEEALRVFG